MESIHRLPWAVLLSVGVWLLGPRLCAQEMTHTANNDLSVNQQESVQQRQQPQQRNEVWRNQPNPRDQQHRMAAPGSAEQIAGPWGSFQGGDWPPGPTQANPTIGGRAVPMDAPPVSSSPTLPAMPTSPPTEPEDVVQLTATIQSELREIGGWLDRLKIAPLTAELGRVVQECEKLATMAAQRADGSALRFQYDMYKLTWLRFATRLRAAPQTDPWLIGHVNAVERTNDLLQELLLVGPGGVYDRVKVARLTAQLADVTSLLLRTVKVQSLTVPGGADLILTAQALHGQAEAMCQGVRQNVAFTLILQHYQQFTTLWTGLMGRLQAPSPFAPQVRTMVEEIGQLDAALKRELLVSPPVYSIHQRRMGLASSVSRLGDALTAALLEQLLANAGPVQAAEDFAQKAESLCLWLEDHPLPQVAITQPEVVAMHEAWRRLANQMNRLERSRFPEAFQIAEQIRGEIATLNQSLRQ